LYERGLGIKDPMDFFEEITRYKLIKGIWPTELLYAPEQLDALAAAYTAWLAVNKPEHISMIGDLKEGRIVLPEKELKEKY
jgi:predicted RNase H-like nuclease